MYGDQSVVVKGREFRIETERVRGSTARVNIRGSLIKIKLPLYMSNSSAAKTYSQFRDWAVKRLEKIDHSTLDPKPRFIEFINGQQLELMGRSFTISILQGGRRSSATLADDGTLKIRVAADLNVDERKEKIYHLVRKAISRSVMDEFTLHAKGLNGRHYGFQLNEIRLRDQTTRWGSCSRGTGSISINFRVLFAPDSVRDYVIIHELAHLKHANHSERFWKLVETAAPDCKESRRWLNKNGNGLGSPKIQPAAQQALQ